LTCQPGVCLRRWCRRHRAIRFAGLVGPSGHGITWSRSQKRELIAQPGKRHRRSRNRMSRAMGFGDPVARVGVVAGGGAGEAFGDGGLPPEACRYQL